MEEIELSPEDGIEILTNCEYRYTNIQNDEWDNYDIEILYQNKWYEIVLSDCFREADCRPGHQLNFETGEWERETKETLIEQCLMGVIIEDNKFVILRSETDG